MPKISIIVPVYKTEKFIRECLESIKQQTFTDWECLLIDDGSPDNSGSICDEFVSADARFKVFHVENGGVSRARNIGLDNMVGEWVIFVDSDDIIAQNTLEMCLNLTESNDLDIVQFSFTRKKEDLGKKECEQTVVLGLNEYIRSKNFLVCAAGSLLRSSIIKNQRLRFDTELKLAEDQLFIYRYMDRADRFLRLRAQLYYYRISASSATNHQRPEDVKKSMEKLTAYKSDYPHWSGIIDKVLVGFLICLILNKDVSLSELKKMTYKANISDISYLKGSDRLFYHVSRINVWLAVYLIRFKFRVIGSV